jgi:hypothetical protein
MLFVSRATFNFDVPFVFQKQAAILQNGFAVTKRRLCSSVLICVSRGFLSHPWKVSLVIAAVSKETNIPLQL